MAAGVAGLGTAVLVSAGSAWAVSAHAGKAGHSAPLMRTMGENAGDKFFLLCPIVSDSVFVSKIIKL